MASQGRLVFKHPHDLSDDLLMWFEKLDHKLDQLISVVFNPISVSPDIGPIGFNGLQAGSIKPTPRPILSGVQESNFEKDVSPFGSEHTWEVALDGAQNNNRERRPSINSTGTRRSHSGGTCVGYNLSWIDGAPLTNLSNPSVGHNSSLGTRRSNTEDFVEELKLDKNMGTFNSVRSRQQFMHAGWIFLTKPQSSRTAMFYKEAMNPLILSGVIFSLIQSVDPPLIAGVPAVAAEISIDGLLAVDILLRFIFCPKRELFLRSFFNVLDLCQVLLLVLRCCTLFYRTQKLSDDLDLQLLLLGVTPFLRLLKLLRRFEKFHLVQRAFQDAFEALPVLLYTAALVWLFFAAIIFFVERRENLDQLPRAMWLTVVTMGTVGYGDYYPKEPQGQIATTFLIIVSAMYMSIPVGIIGNAFNRVWENRIYLLTIKRTRMAISQLGYTPHDVVALFNHFSNARDDGLTYRRFKRMMVSMKVDLQEEQLMELFEEFDRDGGGSVDAKEFVRAVFPEVFDEIFGRDSIGRDSIELPEET